MKVLRAAVAGLRSHWIAMKAAGIDFVVGGFLSEAIETTLNHPNTSLYEHMKTTRHAVRRVHHRSLRVL